MRVVAATCASFVLWTLLSSCILADPAPTLPIVAGSPVTIETSSIVPALGPALITWPRVFEIPVSLTDPSVKIYWLAYVDYSPINGVATLTGPVAVDPTDGAAVRLVRASFDPPLGPGCHTVEIVIAYGFIGTTPTSPPGGASVSWTYTGSGGEGECAPYDAGGLVDAAFPSDGAPSSGDGGAD